MHSSRRLHHVANRCRIQSARFGAPQMTSRATSQLSTAATKPGSGTPSRPMSTINAIHRMKATATQITT